MEFFEKLTTLLGNLNFSQLVLAILLANVVSRLLDTFVNGVVMPTLDLDRNKIIMKVGRVKLHLEHFIQSFIKVIILVFVILGIISALRVVPKLNNYFNSSSKPMVSSPVLPSVSSF